MSDTASRSSMTVDEFLVWAEGRPGRHELVAGRVYAMAPERVRHVEAKGKVYAALWEAIRKAALPCEVFPDGMTVRIDDATAFEPDSLVRCGPPLDGDAIEVPDPLIVVEVLSPGTRNYDAGSKFSGYFTVPYIQHYLMIDPDRRIVIHHRRNEGDIATQIVRSGMLRLDPPGLELSVEDMLGSPDPMATKSTA